MTLGEIGQVYITLAAAETFADHAGLQIEEARRTLHELLLDARQSGPAHQWRRRSNTWDADIDAHVVVGEVASVQGDPWTIVIVTHVSIRGGRKGRRGGRSGQRSRRDYERGE